MDAEASGALLPGPYYRAGDARMTWLDLLLFTGAVYGASWTLTKSKLTARPRRAVRSVALLGPLSCCVACMSAWTSLALALCLGRTSMFSPGFRPEGVTDFVVLMLWSVAASWAIGLGLGDAD